VSLNMTADEAKVKREWRQYQMKMSAMYEFISKEHQNRGVDLSYFEVMSVPDKDFGPSDKPITVLVVRGSLAWNQLRLSPFHCINCQAHIDTRYECVGCRTFR